MTQLSADIETDCLAVHDDTTQFDSFEMWMADYPSLGNYWLEEGLTAGDFLDLSGTWYNGFQWFWADNRPNPVAQLPVRDYAAADCSAKHAALSGEIAAERRPPDRCRRTQKSDYYRADSLYVGRAKYA